MTKDNNFLGCFKIENIPPAKKGVPRIHINISIDPNGIIHVSAKETAMNLESSLSIKS